MLFVTIQVVWFTACPPIFGGFRACPPIFGWFTVGLFPLFIFLDIRAA